MLVLPLLRELRPGPDPLRRVGLVSVAHEGGYCALDVTDRGGVDDPGGLESWILSDADTAEDFERAGGGGGGGLTTDDPPRALYRFQWLFRCRALPQILRVRTASGSVDELVALHSIDTAAPTRRHFVQTTSQSVSRDELDKWATSGVFRQAIPTSIEVLAEAESLAVHGAQLQPTVIETWRGGERVSFRITGTLEDVFPRPENDDPRSVLGIGLANPDGTVRFGIPSGHSGADGHWLSIAYPTAVG